METTGLKSVRTDRLISHLETLPATGRLDLITYTSDIPEGYETGRHRHAYPTTVYVIEGAFRFEEGEQGETVTDYKTGEVFSERAGVVVNGRALAPTKLLVVLPKEPGQPESVTV